MNLGRYIRYLRKRPPAVLVRKSAAEIRLVCREAAARSRKAGPERRIAAALQDDVTRESVADQFRQSLSKRFFFSPHDKDRLLNLLRECGPNLDDLIVREADRACRHVFDLLGSGETFLGNHIDWHWDFVNNYRWPPRRYYRRIRSAPYPGGFDLKVPWELSRCYHFARLGQAFWITNDERYAREFVSQLTSWIEDNPCPLGVNWACPMEVAIRAVNWLWGLAFFVDSPHLTDEFLVRAIASLNEHGQHIFANLEGTPNASANGNHYFSDLVGLLHIGICCPFLKASEDWLRFATRELWAEVANQFLPDGMNFESSTSYHRLVCELALTAIILCRKNGISPPDDVSRRIERALEFVHLTHMPNGLTPIVGDADNGRLHRLAVWNDSDRQWTDYRYLLAIGQTLLGTPRAGVSREHWQDAVWLLGQGPTIPSAETLLDKPRASHAFGDSGVYVMHHQDMYLLVVAGQKGKIRKTAHLHCDLGSVQLHAYGTTFIVDPGTFTYTSNHDQRRLFRSAAQHNAVVVDKVDQHTQSTSDLFTLAAVANSTVNCWQSTAEFDLIEMTMHGYERRPDPIRHRRRILFDKMHELWIVGDFLSCAGTHHATVSYHFNDLALREENERTPRTFIAQERDFGNQLVVQVHSQPMFTGRIETGWISPSYGCRKEAPVLRIESLHTGNAKVVTVLVPVRSDRSVDKRLATVGPIVRQLIVEHFNDKLSNGAND